MTNKVIRDKSICAACVANIKQKHNKKRWSVTLILVIIKHVDILFKVQKKKKNRRNIDSKMLETKNSRLIFTSKCAICGSKKLRFIKEQEAEGLLSNLCLKKHH